MAATPQMTRGIAGGLLALALVGCGREETAQAGSSSVSSSLPVAGTAGPATVWDDSLGSIIAMPSLETGAPTLFTRDSAGTSDTTVAEPIEVELFSHEALTARAMLHPGMRVHGCAWERSATLASAPGQPTPVVWSLALAPGVAVPIAIDGAGELLPRDSAALVAQIHRLVNALPDDSLSAPFRGLPVVVRDVWRFARDDGAVVAVAIASRALNIESNPQAEVTTLIAEPDPASGSGAWRTGFARRAAGPEDRVEGFDLLAAIRLRGGQTAVALMREGERRTHVEVVERIASGAWRLRWSSASLPCER